MGARKNWRRLSSGLSRSADRVSATGWLDRDFHEGGRLLAEQPLEPRFIQQHLLVCRVPERTDLLGPAPASKGLLLDTQPNAGLEMLGCGVTAASFPRGHRMPRDAKKLRQFCLGQPDPCPQRQHQLTESIVWLSIPGSLHEPSPFRPSHPSHAMQRDGT